MHCIIQYQASVLSFSPFPFLSLFLALFGIYLRLPGCLQGLSLPVTGILLPLLLCPLLTFDCASHPIPSHPNPCSSSPFALSSFPPFPFPLPKPFCPLIDDFSQNLRKEHFHAGRTFSYLLMPFYQNIHMVGRLESRFTLPSVDISFLVTERIFPARGGFFFGGHSLALTSFSFLFCFLSLVGLFGVLSEPVACLIVRTVPSVLLRMAGFSC